MCLSNLNLIEFLIVAKLELSTENEKEGCMSYTAPEASEGCV